MQHLKKPYLVTMTHFQMIVMMLFETSTILTLRYNIHCKDIMSVYVNLVLYSCIVN